jgi:tRNA dimethylallyltransferase
MAQTIKPILVAALLGPTAVGKSNVAVDIASPLKAEIVSVDSMQVYRGMDIGTAKPQATQRQRVPHHLLDIVEPSDNYSAAEYQVAARLAVEEIANRNKLPLFVGGTGLYFETVVFDVHFPPGSIDDPLRRKLEEWAAREPEGLRSALLGVDPVFASSESYANLRRVIRAMEIYERTGKPASSFRTLRGEQQPYYMYVGAVLNAPRQVLRRLIDARVDNMIENGLIEEVKKIQVSGGFSRTARQALGYKEILEHLDRGKSLEETICNIKERTLRYAKRQLTWFRRIPGLRWFELQEEDYCGERPRTLREIRDYFEEEKFKRSSEDRDEFL